LFTLTLVVSAILFGYGFGLMSAAALLLVLFVHELGHLLAMWVFDYRNLSVFFLPFLGAAATGHKPEAPAWQEASVLLAGPVFGLLAALAVSQIPSDLLPPVMTELARSFVWFGFILNLFNLLPAGMLDGGRLFELAVLGRFPFARAMFVSLGVVIGLSFAVWSQSFVFGCFMLLLALNIPLQFKTARIIIAIRAKNKDIGKSALTPAYALQSLGQEFAHGEYGSTGSQQWSQRVNLARSAYPRLLQAAPSLTVSVGILLTHLLALIVPLIFVIWNLQSIPINRTTTAEQLKVDQESAATAKVAEEAFTTGYNAEHDPAAKWAMLDQYEDESELYDSPWISQQRSGLLEQLPSDHAGKLRYLFDRTTSSSDKMMTNHLLIINKLTMNGTRQALDLDKEQFELLVGTYEQLAQEASTDVLGYHLPILAELWATLDSSRSVYAEYRPQVASICAHMAFASGKVDDAHMWMKRYQEVGGQEAHHAMAWFLLDSGHAEQALNIAKQALAVPTPQKNVHIEWQTLAGWAEMSLGHPQQADSYFKAVLDRRVQLREEGFQHQPWWIRLLTKPVEMQAQSRTWLDAQTLDHLAALSDYDVASAKKIIEGLNKQQPSYVTSTVDGWGKIRAVTHAKVLKAWGFPDRREISL
jgi:Zn-dependent protease